MKDVLTIREGTAEQDDERSKIGGVEQAQNIPSNVSFLKEVSTTKTTVRKAKDYPVLRERFVK